MALYSIEYMNKDHSVIKLAERLLPETTETSQQEKTKVAINFDYLICTLNIKDG